MIHCKDCAHFREPLFCVAPENGASPIDGSPRVISALVSRRSPSFYDQMNEWCGPLALNFNPKPTPPRPWWKLWGARL
jgi:hypothetical protein